MTNASMVNVAQEFANSSFVIWSFVICDSTFDRCMLEPDA
jgi:hypothetical protein